MDVGERVAGLSLWHTWPLQDQRTLHALLVNILFAEQAVAPHPQPVIRRVDHQRVVGVRTALERLHDAPDLFVQMRHQAVVFAELIADDLPGSGPRGKAFVATGGGLRRILKGMLGKIVRRQRRTILIVHLPVFLGRIARVVRSHERHVEEERFVSLGLLNVPDCLIRKHRAGKTTGIPLLAQLSILQVLYSEVGVVRHAPHVHRPAIGERPVERTFPVVPLTDDERLVPPALGQQRGQDGGVPPVRCRPVSRQIHPVPAGHQHRPAGHAHRAAERTRTVVAPKTEAPLRHPVEVGRANVRIAVGSDRVRPLVIGEKKNDIRRAITRRRLAKRLAKRNGNK